MVPGWLATPAGGSTPQARARDFDPELLRSGDLIRYRETVRSVRWELRNRAIRLEAEAAAMRATETVGSPSGVVVDVV